MSKRIKDGPHAGETAVADVYAQPGANTQPVDPASGQRIPRPLGKGPDKRDINTTVARGIRAYTIGKKKMWRTTPDGKVKVILSGKHFRAYMGQEQ